MINKSEQVKKLFKGVAPRILPECDGLGSIPIIGEEENRNLLAALIGTTMGGVKKASIYKWFRNRLADTRGIIVPRSMLDIFAKAASKELEFRRSAMSTASKSIIRPRCFEDSLELVSKQRLVTEQVRYHFTDIYLKGLGLQRAGMR